MSLLNNVHACVCTHTRHPIRCTKDVLYPVGHLSLLCSYWTRNLRDFKASEQSANKRLLNMSATPADDVQTSPAWNCGCKYTTFFWYDQIKMPFMQISHKWHYVLLLITLAWIYYFLMIFSAICTAFKAAPLRIWSPTHQKVIPLAFAKSLRIRPTYTSSVPLKYNGIG